MTYPKIKMEKPSTYNGLDWLVALDEGLFAKEGLEVELVAHGGDRETNVKVTDWNQGALERRPCRGGGTRIGKYFQRL